MIFCFFFKYYGFAQYKISNLYLILYRTSFGLLKTGCKKFLCARAHLSRCTGARGENLLLNRLTFATFSVEKIPFSIFLHTVVCGLSVPVHGLRLTPCFPMLIGSVFPIYITSMSYFGELIIIIYLHYSKGCIEFSGYSIVSVILTQTLTLSAS